MRSATGAGMLFSILLTLAVVGGDVSLWLASLGRTNQRPSPARQCKGESERELDENEKTINHQSYARPAYGNGITVGLLYCTK